MTSSGEWQVIDRFFSQLGAVRTDVLLGIGDDAALLRPAADMELAQTTDSLVEQVHFLPGAPPRSLGHRLLAVNLSDLAAMGATPAWALLSLTLPSVDEAWLAGFAAGLGQLARLHEVALVGGNLSRGPLNLG
ncbi:MAG: AIR synthase related protein, partial [Steroidobacteraceae bacterium]